MIDGILPAHDPQPGKETVNSSLPLDRLKEEIQIQSMAQRLQSLNRLHGVVTDVNRAIIRHFDRDSLYGEVCRIAVERGEFLLCWIGSVEDTHGEVLVAAQCGATGYLDGGRMTVDDGEADAYHIGVVVREGILWQCNDLLNVCRGEKWQERVRKHRFGSSAAVPLKLAGRVAGVLTLYAAEKDYFDQQQTDLLRQMADDISFALEMLESARLTQPTEQTLEIKALERLWTLKERREQDRIVMQQARHSAMGEMIGNIAHQWRQPLNLLGLIIQDIPITYHKRELTEEYLTETVTNAKSLVFKMSRTIDDFRDFFRIDNERVRFPIVAALNRTLELVKEGLASWQIKVCLSINGDPTVYGYPNQFSQAIFNILVNSRDVFQERKTPDPEIRATVTTEGERAIIVLADNGGGIPETVLEKVFEPYFTTKGPDKGTGIGLYMSKTIIERYPGGTLSARNNATGAEFRIEIPL